MFTLVEENILKSVMQNIRVILTTPKGSDIHRPDFGSNLHLFIDKPLTAIEKGRLKAEITDAIETWEKRAKVKKIEIEKDYLNGGIKVRATLDVEGVGEVEGWL